MVPRRPRPKLNASNSFIGRKNKKRMILDSDTENSIIIEHDHHRKVACLKDTPLKIDSGKKNKRIIESDDEDQITESDHKADDQSEDNDEENHKIDTGPSDQIGKRGVEDGDEEAGDSDDDEDSDDDGLAEEQMLMSRATRMSIMGVIPKDNESDESDFIQSDDVSILVILELTGNYSTHGIFFLLISQSAISLLLT